MSRIKEMPRRWAGVVIMALVPLLAGCDNFFTKNTTGGGGGGGTPIGSSGANYAYVLNLATGTISGFLIGTGTLTAVPGSPFSLGFVPLTAIVTRANNFLYVAGPSALYSVGINSDGSLSAATSVAIASEVALAVSPDGQWLFGLNSQSLTLDEWQLNQTNGNVTAMPGAAYTLTNVVASPMMLRVSPSGNLVFAALGIAGDHVFTLNTSTGAVASSQHLYLGSTQTSDNGVAVDNTGSTLYIARSGQNSGLGVYTIGALGALTSISGSPFPTGQGTFDVAVDATGKYVYAANRTDGTITGFSIGAGSALTALGGSPYAAGKLVTSLLAERSGKYLLAAAAGGSPDLTLYSFDTTTAGKLNAATNSSSGAQPAGSSLIALAH